jgi:hypothetical protein
LLLSALLAGRAAALTVIARYYRRVGRVPLEGRGASATLGSRLCLLGERHTPKRHRQRQHQRRDQQRNALPHLFSPPLPFSQHENRLTSFTEIAGCATGSARPSYSAHLYGSGVQSLYLELADFLRADSIMSVLVAVRVCQVAYICGYLGVTSTLLCGELRRIPIPRTSVYKGKKEGPWPFDYGPSSATR